MIPRGIALESDALVQRLRTQVVGPGVEHEGLGAPLERRLEARPHEGFAEPGALQLGVDGEEPDLRLARGRDTSVRRPRPEHARCADDAVRLPCDEHGTGCRPTRGVTLECAPFGVLGQVAVRSGREGAGDEVGLGGGLGGRDRD